MAVITGTTYAYPSKVNKYLNTQRATGMPETKDNPSSLPITTTNIEIYANGMKVGFVQSFNPSESRSNKKISELGTEGVVQIVPGNTQGGQISLQRIAIYNSSLFNAIGLTRTGQFVVASDASYVSGDAKTLDDENKTYGNPFKCLKDQRVPLELQSKTRLPDNSSDKYLVLTYVDCWLSSYSKQYQAQDVTVTESATIMYSDVYQTISSSNS